MKDYYIIDVFCTKDSKNIYFLTENAFSSSTDIDLAWKFPAEFFIEHPEKNDGHDYIAVPVSHVNEYVRPQVANEDAIIENFLNHKKGRKLDNNPFYL